MIGEGDLSFGYAKTRSCHKCATIQGQKQQRNGWKEVRKGGIEVRKTAAADPFLVAYPRILYMSSVVIMKYNNEMNFSVVSCIELGTTSNFKPFSICIHLVLFVTPIPVVTTVLFEPANFLSTRILPRKCPSALARTRKPQMRLNQVCRTLTKRALEPVACQLC